jgi:hypothetical protein
MSNIKEKQQQQQQQQQHIDSGILYITHSLKIPAV